ETLLSSKPNDAAATMVAAASAASSVGVAPSTGTASSASATVTSASAAAANVVAPADAGNNAGQQGMADGQQQQGDSAQRTRAAKPLRLSQAMQNRQIEVVRQISRAMGLRAATRAEGTMKLMLTPPTLGTISLEISFDEQGALRVEGVTDNDATRHLLSGSVDELRQALRQENIELARFVMSERHGQAFQNDARSAQDQNSNQQQQASGGRPQGSVAGGANEDDNAASAASGSVKLGAVDLQA
ncbi:MAG: flagellar hook-length control protein FliK, partial [Planctomycetes bacterium]|nr:flagellar hook-length control protein FliK [Planctomycetota bacterium]